MDCHRAQAQLEFARLGQGAVSGPDASAAETHLAECDVCRAAVASGRQFDEQVTRAMLDVPIPAGLANRLRAAVGPETIAVEASTAVPRRHVLRRLGWGSLALVPLIFAATLLMSRPVVLNDANVRELGKVDPALLPVATSPGLALPAGWGNQRAIQFADAPRLATVKGIELRMQTFTARTDRRSPVCSGALIRLSRSQWYTVPDADSFSSATVQYAAFGTWVVWQEGDSVVLCILQGDAHVMQRLQELIAAGRQLT